MIAWLVAPAVALLMVDALLLVRFAFPPVLGLGLRTEQVPAGRRRLVAILYAIAALGVAFVAVALLG